MCDDTDVKSGKVELYAPKDFLDYALAENVLAGTGLGLGDDSPGFIPATIYIKRTGEKRRIDGVPIVFQIANGTEAPSEMMFDFPQQKALRVAEVANQLMHTVYTIRGAQGSCSGARR